MCLLIVRLDLTLFTTRFLTFSATIDYHFNLGGVITSLVLGVMQKGKRHVKYDWAITPYVMLKINKSDFSSNVKNAVFAFAVLVSSQLCGLEMFFAEKKKHTSCSPNKKVSLRQQLLLQCYLFLMANSIFFSD